MEGQPRGERHAHQLAARILDRGWPLRTDKLRRSRQKRDRRSRQKRAIGGAGAGDRLCKLIVTSDGDDRGAARRTIWLGLGPTADARSAKVVTAASTDGRIDDRASADGTLELGQGRHDKSDWSRCLTRRRLPGSSVNKVKTCALREGTQSRRFLVRAIFSLIS